MTEHTHTFELDTNLSSVASLQRGRCACGVYGWREYDWTTKSWPEWKAYAGTKVIQKILCQKKQQEDRERQELFDAEPVEFIGETGCFRRRRLPGADEQ